MTYNNEVFPTQNTPCIPTTLSKFNLEQTNATVQELQAFLSPSTFDFPPKTVILYAHCFSWIYLCISWCRLPKRKSGYCEGLRYFSRRESFRWKVCDASVETISCDFEEHFHEFFLLFLLHYCFQSSLFCLIEVHDWMNKRREECSLAVKIRWSEWTTSVK